MACCSKSVLKSLLEAIERVEIFPAYRFYRVNNEFCLLGTGKHSIVYEMHSKKEDKAHCALKIVFVDQSKMTEQDYITALKLQKRLGNINQNILRVLDIKIVNFSDINNGSEGGVAYLILLEKLECMLVHRDKGKDQLVLKENEVIHLGIQMCEALMELHRCHYLHRDIKLENIYVDRQCRCFKLGDFDYAVREREARKEIGICTKGYSPPEIIKVNDTYTIASEIYALGICLYLLLNDYKFPASESYRVNKVQYSSYFTFPAPIRASAQLARLLRKMCSYDKKDRYQSINEVQAALKKLI